MAIKARVSCVKIIDFGGWREVYLRPVTIGEDADPNKSFTSDAADDPVGEFMLQIDNPDAFRQFIVREIYDVVFTPTSLGPF